MDRELDGIYFRLKRNNRWENVCFSDMTEEQMYEVMKDRDADWFKSVCVRLATCLKEIGDQFDICCGHYEDDE